MLDIRNYEDSFNARKLAIKIAWRVEDLIDKIKNPAQSYLRIILTTRTKRLKRLQKN